MSNNDPETTSPEGADSELVELQAPPAPPTAHNPDDPTTSPVEGEQADEEDGADTPPAPSPHSSSPGFGTTAKFTEATSIRDRMRELQDRDK